MNTFEKNTLLTIYRQYSLDEGVAYLKSVISPLQQEIGMLNSELGEIKEKLKQKNIQIDELLKERKQLKKEIQNGTSKNKKKTCST